MYRNQSLTQSVVELYGDVSFEWDEAKSTRNARERNLPFDLAPLLFAGPRLITEDRRKDYGEARFQLIGLAGSEILYCIYTMRANGVCRIISLRHTNRRERHAYRTAHPG